MIIKVIYGQTLMDVAIQYYGDPSALVDLANDNGLGIDADVFAGQSLLVQDTYPLSANSYYADYLAQNGIRVVSGQGGDTATIGVLATNDNEVLADNDTNAIQI